jgi:hypothetical protein
VVGVGGIGVRGRVVCLTSLAAGSIAPASARL